MESCVPQLSLLLGKSGLFMFVMGLFIGVLIAKFRNSRMGLSAHLTAVQVGTFLLALGAFWPHMGIPPVWDGYLVAALILSSYMLVAGLTASAITGASSVLPIAGAGFTGSSSQELVVSILVLSASVLMLFASTLVLFFFLLN
jgi:(hydroxyamino)benzene mutase